MKNESLELDLPRSIREMLVVAFELYRRVPVLFLVFAAILVVPYEVIVLVITGKGPFALGQIAFIPRQLIVVIESFLVTPLVSALHIHAVREVGDGGRPRLLPTLRRSLPTLPTVVIATGVSSVALLAGTILVVPGLFLLAIWAVVAQAAAIEGGSWIGALRRSAELTRGYRWHALGLVLAAGAIAAVPWLPLWIVFKHAGTNGITFLAGTAVQVVLHSFEALTAAVLYFDLKARPRGGEAHVREPGKDPDVPVSEAPSGTGDPLTPGGYADADRPRGWYIDPSQPKQMRYWAAGDKPVWSRRTAKTPGQTLVEWKELKGRQEEDPEKP
jgi:hypothetical protein